MSSNTINPLTHEPNQKVKNELNLIWVDMEMTGLNPKTDKIIEIAIVVTNSHLEIIDQMPPIAIHQSLETLKKMDKWNTSVHGKSGLTERVKQSEITEVMATQQCLDFLKPITYANKSPMCGNSICQDRRFMFEYMPILENYFHYRNIDVSTLKELAKRWQPGIAEKFIKQQKHTALADILESIEELKHYREFFIGLTQN